MSTVMAPIASTPAVLIVDDEPAMRTALEISFQRRGWQTETGSGKADALARFARRKHPLLVSDVRMPDGTGFEVMHAVRKISSTTGVILLTAFGTVPDAVAAMKAGASEYVTKPVSFERLLDTAERILSRRAQPKKAADEMIGSSAALRAALERAERAAECDADVLIEAESGTGKELLARRIHRLSSRRDHPFIGVNCAALPESLLESELFGHGRGAFTGAVASHPGKFQLAAGGTLLLDEIGEMPLSLQPKLLRVLQEREFYPLGTTQPVRVNVRIVATTNRSLASLVREGRFRADLYYRLAVIPLSLPPLRERHDDIRALALHFFRKFDESGTELSESFLAQLEDQPWPGNVRELANVVRRALALGEVSLRMSNHAAQGLAARLRGEDKIVPINVGDVTALAAGMSLAETEKSLLTITLDATAGNRSRAAEMLGISLRTVRNKIREYNLPPRSEYAHD